MKVAHGPLLSIFHTVRYGLVHEHLPECFQFHLFLALILLFWLNIATYDFRLKHEYESAPILLSSILKNKD